MINGAHVVIYSTDPEADRAFFRDVLKFPNVDVGGGWLIFGLPASELGIHPSEGDKSHELFLMCDDIRRFVAMMKKRRVQCGPILRPSYGLVTVITLPGGGKLGVYEPRHERPSNVRTKRYLTNRRKTGKI